MRLSKGERPSWTSRDLLAWTTESCHFGLVPGTEVADETAFRSIGEEGSPSWQPFQHTTPFDRKKREVDEEEGPLVFLSKDMKQAPRRFSGM